VLHGDTAAGCGYGTTTPRDLLARLPRSDGQDPNCHRTALLVARAVFMEIVGKVGRILDVY